ncbi:MAG TPA: calcium-binding protein [Acidimicrobiia bacterium]|nr:calcium-binding protein [Acidimicrobiia bacterium]
MAGRISLGRRGGRAVVVLATAAYITGMGVVGAPPGNTIGGSCNGRLATASNGVMMDASHEHGPVIIEGSDDADVIIGSKGDDTIHGNGGEDTICGGHGADDIFGGDDADAIFGEGGDDTLRGDFGNDLISGGRGNDNMVGGDDNDQLYGNKGDDLLNGVDAGGEDKLSGGDGRNLCFVDASDEPEDCKF